MSSTKKTTKPSRSAIQDVVAREYTIHLHKRVRLPARDERYPAIRGRRGPIEKSMV